MLVIKGHSLEGQQGIQRAACSASGRPIWQQSPHFDHQTEGDYKEMCPVGHIFADFLVHSWRNVKRLKDENDERREQKFGVQSKAMKPNVGSVPCKTQARGVDDLGISWKHDVALITNLVVVIMIPTTRTTCIIYDDEKYEIF